MMNSLPVKQNGPEPRTNSRESQRAEAEEENDGGGWNRRTLWPANQSERKENSIKTARAYDRPLPRSINRMQERSRLSKDEKTFCEYPEGLQVSRLNVGGGAALADAVQAQKRDQKDG